MLIGDEPEKGMENLLEVKIPEDVEEKLTKADIQEQQELEKEEKEQEEEEEKKKNSETGKGEEEQEAGLIQ